jgi:hypothetical protein
MAEEDLDGFSIPYGDPLGYPAANASMEDLDGENGEDFHNSCSPTNSESPRNPIPLEERLEHGTEEIDDWIGEPLSEFYI